MPREGIIEGRGPVYDPSDDPDSDDFINENDKLRKTFKTPDSIPSGERDFSNSLKVNRRAELVKEADELLAAEDQDLKAVRNDISKYTYNQRGTESSNLASFHVDHDNQKVTAVYENATDTEDAGNEKKVAELETVERMDSEKIKDAPSEESFAKKGIAQDRKINAEFIPYAESRAYVKNEYSNKSDNLQTRPLRKRLRDTRGEIREHLHGDGGPSNNRSWLQKFFDKKWNKN